VIIILDMLRPEAVDFLRKEGYSDESINGFAFYLFIRINFQYFYEYLVRPSLNSEHVEGYADEDY